MFKYIFALALLSLLSACVQTKGLNTARVNVDRYNQNQQERMKQSGLDELIDEKTKKQPDNKISETASLSTPLSRADERVTKKPFGIKIERATSPVQPERFSGYHTGTDFEILPGEETADVPVFAVCAGRLLQKMSVSGYGGVAVQSCFLNNQPITVIYGHLRLASITAEVGEELLPGVQFAVLGAGNSVETDNERKHLHLGIRRGNDINLLGYVQNENELDGWLDIMEYLK